MVICIIIIIAVSLIKAEIILLCAYKRGLVFSVGKILSKGAVSHHLVHFVSIAKSFPNALWNLTFAKKILLNDKITASNIPQIRFPIIISKVKNSKMDFKKNCYTNKFFSLFNLLQVCPLRAVDKCNPAHCLLSFSFC